ncbi:MAG: ATP-binding protein [Rhodospirillales bacterium]|nr:ATP-binding protein [Rhodospirillales bacterium]
MSPKKTIRLILFGGFFSMILLTIVLGVGAIRISDNLIELNTKILNHPFVVSNTLRDIKSDIFEIHRYMKDVVLVGHPLEVERAIGAIEKRETEALERFGVVYERYLGDKADVDAARRSFAEWKAIRAEVITLVTMGEPGQAKSVADTKGARHIQVMSGQIDGLIAFAHNKAAEFRDLSLAEYERNRLILFALISGVVISTGLIAGLVLYMITRVERDLAQKEEWFRQSQKMEAVGQLTGGLAHDLNNVLSIISMNVGILNSRLKEIPDAAKHLESLEKGVLRAADLTRKLLDFSRTRPEEITRISVNGFIQDLESLIKKSLTPAIELKVALSQDAWKVDIDPGDFETSLLNLALNGRDAMPEGGILVIETVNKIIDQHYVSRNPGSSVGDFVLVSVSDTGTGMRPETVQRAFEPFFTTKDVGLGTGLGLSMVYGFVQRSGGHVKIYSEPGEGTTVHLYLPRARGPADNALDRRFSPDDLPSGDEVILVVDDEADLVNAAELLLKSLGYRVIAATDARKALDIIKGDTPIDLLFSDVVMPGGMDGYQLAVEALKQRPDLRILLTSGFTRIREELANGERRIEANLSKTLLQKPYNIAELAMAIRRQIDQPHPATHDIE